MANPRRNTQSSENPFHAQTLTFSSVTHFLKKPHAFPFLLSIFLFLTWVSLRLQHSSSPSRFSINKDDAHKKWSQSSDSRANLVRFGSGFPSPIAKDKRGWLLDPISLAKDSRISGTPPFSFCIFRFWVRRESRFFTKYAIEFLACWLCRLMVEFAFLSSYIVIGK